MCRLAQLTKHLLAGAETHLKYDGDRAAGQHAHARECAVQQRERDCERPLQPLPPRQERLGVCLVRRLAQRQQVVQVRRQLVRHVLRCRDAVVAIAHHEQAAVGWPAERCAPPLNAIWVTQHASTESFCTRVLSVCCDMAKSHLSAGLLSLPERMSSA